jgi:diguanylate cyclase (GGDEF)-like protein
VNFEDLLSKLWHWLLLRVVFFLLATALGRATAPLSDWIVKRAARRWPAQYQDDLKNQWLADFASLPPWLRLKSALSVLHAGPGPYRHLGKRNLLQEDSGPIDIDTLRLGSNLDEDSTRDGLTGLMNRRSFQKAISKLFGRSRLHHRQLFLILADIDGLRPFNSVCGHSAGDALVREIARRLQAQLRRRDRICRFGGDEFGILLPWTSVQEAGAMAETLRRSCEIVVRGSCRASCQAGQNA